MAGDGAQHGSSAGRFDPLLAVDMASALVGDLLDKVGADAGFVATPVDDGRSLAVARVTPYSEKPVHLDVPADAPYPLAATIRNRAPLVIANNEALCEHPGLVRMKSEDHACVTQPLFGEGGELLGAVNVAFDEPRDFTAEELGLVEVLARHCADAMALARRYQAALQGTRAGAPANA